ncbi:MAG: LLM class flavin-dependent oxidoreductase [Pseudomonadota bacterium]
MKLAIEIGRTESRSLDAMVEWVQFAERRGVAMAFSSEAWWSDAVTPIAYLADKTSAIRLGTGIMQTVARTPAMTAMTALTLNDLTGGRFVLGLGASGPQVVEGLHGVSFKRPLTRLRETVDIVRRVFSGEKVTYEGELFQLPLPHGEGKSIRVAHDPVQIPIYLATLGPRSLRYTGAAADGWLGTSFSPERADAHLDYIRTGIDDANRSLSALDLCVSVRVAIGDEVEAMVAARKKGVAFNLGAMGSADTNFYNDAFKRAGFVDDANAVRALWMAGDREGAAKRVPDVLVTEFQAIGTADMVLERLRRYRDVGITTLKLGLDSATAGPARYELLEQVVDMVDRLNREPGTTQGVVAE